MVIIIGITGAFGSGKTTLAKQLQEHYGRDRCQIISLNSDTIDPDHFDFSALSSELEAARVRFEVDVSTILLVEGAFVFHPMLLKYLDIKIFVDTDPDLCLVRLIKQNLEVAEDTLALYEDILRPLNMKYILPQKDMAELILHNNRRVFDMDLLPVLDYVSHQMKDGFLHRRLPHIVSPTFDAAKITSSKPGTLFVISGPSGVGKTTLLKTLLRHNLVEKLVPYTTRPCRATEVDGVDYQFITEDAFMEMTKTVPFLQRIEGFGHHYGIPAPDVLEKLAKGQSLIVDLTPDALAQVRLKVKNIKSIFICPPAMTSIMERLNKRCEGGPENQTRYDFSRKMLEEAAYQEYDYLIVNESLPKAEEALLAIVLADASTLERQQRNNTVFFKRFKIHQILEKLRDTVLPLLDVSSCDIRSLSSLTNSSYRIVHGDSAYFLRVLRQANGSYRVQPEQEYHSLQKISALGLYPSPLYYDVTTGAYLTPFLSDYVTVSPDKMCVSPIFESVIQSIKQLHQSAPFEHDHAPLMHIELILMQLRAKNTLFPADMDSMMITCHRIAELLKVSCKKTVPCNNDLSPYNMLYRARDNHVVLTDWECAGNNDPFWDLAKLSVEAHFNEEQDFKLLNHYHEATVTEVDLSRFILFKVVIELHLALWAKWQLAIENDATTTYLFDRLFLVRLDNCRKHIAAIDFARHIHVVESSIEVRHRAMFPGRFLAAKSPSDHAIEVVKPVLTRNLSQVFFKSSGFAPCETMEQTLLIMKPDMVKHAQVGDVIRYLEHRGFKPVAYKLKQFTADDVCSLYPKIETQVIRYDVLDLMTSGPVFLVVLEGVEVARKLQILKGATDPERAEEGTLRKLFGTTAKWNAVHCSDNAHEAHREIALFFDIGELCLSAQVMSC